MLTLRELKSELKDADPVDKQWFNRLATKYDQRNVWLVGGEGNKVYSAKKHLAQNHHYSVWVPQPIAKEPSVESFFHLSQSKNSPSFTLSTDGAKEGYTYDTILKEIQTQYLSENGFTHKETGEHQTVDAITLKTSLLYGGIFKVHYAIFSHPTRESEPLYKYTLESKLFNNLKQAKQYANVNLKKNKSSSSIVSINYDPGAIELKNQYFGFVPVVGAIERLGRLAQKRLSKRKVRLTWLKRVTA